MSKGNNKINANKQIESQNSKNQGKREMMRSDGKPPLPRSPIRLRSRRVLQSEPKILRTPSSAGKSTNTKLPKRVWDTEEQDLRPEYATISCEMRALAKMVQGEFKENEMGISWNTNQTPLFERGRFYEEYSVKRNERLKRKKGHLIGDEKKYDLGVRVESAKKKDIKKCKSLRKVVPATPLTDRRENSRYSLRSSSLKVNKKPPLPMAVSYDKSVGGTGKKIGARRIGKI